MFMTPLAGVFTVPLSKEWALLCIMFMPFFFRYMPAMVALSGLLV